MTTGSNEQFERETQKVARQRQEMVESKREIAQCLYRYTGPTLFGQGCALLAGDYMQLKDNCLCSTRQTQIPMSSEQLAEMIDDGVITKVFNPDDINSSDFAARMDEIMLEIQSQSLFQDADLYMINDECNCGLAKYVSEHDPEEVIAYAERVDDKITMRPEVTLSEDVVEPMRECSYDEFNPGGRQMQKQADSVNKERENRGNAYAKLREEYLANGGNSVKEPGEILQNKEMSAKDRLTAYRDAQDTIEEQQQSAQQLQIQDNVDDMGYLPKSVRRLYE